MKIEIRGSLKHEPGIEKIGILVIVLIIPAFLLISVYWFYSIATTNRISILSFFIFFSVFSIIIGIVAALAVPKVILYDNEIIFKKILVQRMDLRDLVGIYIGRRRGKLMAFIAGRSNALVIGYEFEEEDTKKIIDRLREIAKTNKIEFKENVPESEIDQIYDSIYSTED